MKLSNNRLITVTRGLYLYLAVLLLLLPLDWLIALSISAAVHELFHLVAIRILGLRVYSIKIGPFGARIYTEPMEPAKELVCALAGPLGGFILLLVAKWIPMTALCAVFQSLYNLLPVYPSDGGRAMHCLIHLLAPPRWATSICTIADRMILALLAMILICFTIQFRIGLLPMLVVAVPVLGRLCGKIPCKDALDKVQ